MHAEEPVEYLRSVQVMPRLPESQSWDFVPEGGGNSNLSQFQLSHSEYWPIIRL